MSYSFDRFRRKATNQIVSTDRLNAKFIFEGYPTIHISFKEDGRKNQLVSFVNKQEKDMAYVYTFYNEPLQIGDIFTAKSLICLVTEEIEIIKHTHFRKYIALICNADLNDNNWGYFKGPMKSYINVTTKEDLAALSQQKPILVARQGYFNIHDTISVNGRPWLIIEADTISNPVIGYYSLKATTESKNQEVIVENPEIIQKVSKNKDYIEVKYLQSVDLNTEDGYYISNKKMDNLSITKDTIHFTIPCGLDEFVVKIKEQGIEKEIKYKVV